MTRNPSTVPHPLEALRRFARPRGPEERAEHRCELCSLALRAEHQHLVELASRKLLCCCDACAVLFDTTEGGRFRRVPRRVEALGDFRLSDEHWESLNLPIGLAFFFRSTPAGRVLAFYPGPAGAAESLLSLDAWREIEEENPVLLDFQADVEALLVHRVRPHREYFRVPVDECYRLVGLLRAHWTGLSGGSEVWEAVDRFFAELRERSGPAGGTT